MNKQEMLDALRATKSEQEWNDTCDLIKAQCRLDPDCGDYPHWWFADVIVSGFMENVSSTW